MVYLFETTSTARIYQTDSLGTAVHFMRLFKGKGIIRIGRSNFKIIVV